MLVKEILRTGKEPGQRADRLDAQPLASQLFDVSRLSPLETGFGTSSASGGRFGPCRGKKVSTGVDIMAILQLEVTIREKLCNGEAQ